MGSEHPVKLPAECIMKGEVFVHWQECVNPVYTQPLSLGIMRSVHHVKMME